MSWGDIGLELFVRLYRLTWVILAVAPALILAFWARRRVSEALRSGWDVDPGQDQAAEGLARSILRREGLSGRIELRTAEGPLATYFDPRLGELRLSEDVARGWSPSLLGLAAHEAGHAIQQGQGFRPLWLRTPLVFASGIGSRAAWVVILTGIALDFPELAMRGALLLLGSVLASLLLVPIEIDANRRVARSLQASGSDGGLLESLVTTGLRSAAWDHVAATLPGSTQPASSGIVRRLQRPTKRPSATLDRSS